MTAETGGEYRKIGGLLDFNILVKTEHIFANKYNRFYVEGACKYAYNNGNLANDPLKAATNFIKALDRIPALIETYREDIGKLRKDIPQLQKVLNTPWRKQEELNELKGRLDTLSRRIKESQGNSSLKNNTKVKKDPDVISIKPVMPANKPKSGIRM